MPGKNLVAFAAQAAGTEHNPLSSAPFFHPEAW